MSHGISPWRPNQHGAWAMLIAPAVAGTLAAVVAHPAPKHTATIAAILIAWFTGYFAFFAFGLAAKARTPQRRRHYAAPIAVYGPLSLAGMAAALLLQPQLTWWAIAFAPLVGIAVWETLRGRPRSFASGASTTVASALLVPVLYAAARGLTPAQLPAHVYLACLFLALYFTGTIPVVKSMIRERNNPGYVRFSVGFHVAALVVFLAAWAGIGRLIPAAMAALLAVALWRAWWIPHTRTQGRVWTAKQIGKFESPFVSAATVLVIAALVI